MQKAALRLELSINYQLINQLSASS